MPIAVMARGIFTDCLQRFFGNLKSEWAHTLTRSRISRALHGVIKTFAFIFLTSAGIFKGIVLEQGSLILATIAVGFVLLRGLPFFFNREHHTKYLECTNILYYI